MTTTKIKKFELNKDLSYISQNFIFKAIKACLVDASYLPTNADVLKAEYFHQDDYATEDVAEEMIEYVKKYGTTPTIPALFDILKERAKGDEVENNKYRVIYEKLKETSIEGCESTKEMLRVFALEHFIVDELNDAYSKLTGERYKGKPEKIIENMRDKLEYQLCLANKSLLSIAPNEYDIESEEEKEAIPTGEEVLDKIFTGGPRRGTVAGIISPSGYGKTTFLTAFAYGAVLKGYKVMQIFFEDDESDIVRKHWAKMTGINTSKINKAHSDNLTTIKGDANFNILNRENILLEKMENKSVTIKDIEVLLRKRANEGFLTDVLFLDYFDCLKFSTNPYKESFEARDEAIKKLEVLAKKLNILIWVGFQTNRKGYSKDSDAEDTATSMQGSIGQFQTLSQSILLRKDNNGDNDYMRLVDIEKNRNGRRCKISNVYVNNGTLEINWDNMNIKYLDPPMDGDEDIVQSKSEDEWLKTLEEMNNLSEPQIEVRQPVQQEPFRLTINKD